MDGEDGLKFTLFVYCIFPVLQVQPMQSKHKQTKCKHSRWNSCRGITILNQRIIQKDGIEFVT